MRHIIAILLAILLPAIAKAQPTGIWEAKFGSSPEECVEAIKKQKQVTPANIETYGKITAVTYEPCVIDNQSYTSIQLMFFNRQLCWATLECNAGDHIYQTLIETYTQLYGAPKSSTPKLTGWSFGKEYTILISNKVDKGIVTTSFFFEPGYKLYDDEVKRLPDDTQPVVEYAASPTTTTAKNTQPLKELTGFWGIKFGQSPETVISTIKTTKKYAPSRRIPEGKATSLYYNNCMFGPDKCTEVFLAFYNNKLCGALFTIPSTQEHVTTIIEAMQNKYGPAEQTTETNGVWNFKNRNGLLVHMIDDQTAEIFYSREAELDLFSKEHTKTKTADY